MVKKGEVRKGEDQDGWRQAAILAEWTTVVVQLVQLILGILR